MNLIKLKIISIAITIILASLSVSSNINPVIAAEPNGTECGGLFGFFDVRGVWPAGSTFNISCPGRAGTCPGDSQTVSPGDGFSFDLNGCNCIVGGGEACLSVAGLPEGCNYVGSPMCTQNGYNTVGSPIIQCPEPPPVCNTNYQPSGNYCKDSNTRCDNMHDNNNCPGSVDYDDANCRPDPSCNTAPTATPAPPAPSGSWSGACIDSSTFQLRNSSGMTGRAVGVYTDGPQAGRPAFDETASNGWTHWVETGSNFDWRIDGTSSSGSNRCTTSGGGTPTNTTCYTCNNCKYDEVTWPGASCPGGSCDPRVSQQNCSGGTTGGQCNTSDPDCLPWSGSGVCSSDGRNFEITTNSPGYTYANYTDNDEYAWQGEWFTPGSKWSHSVQSGREFRWYANGKYQGTAKCSLQTTQCCVCNNCIYYCYPIAGTSCPAGACDTATSQDQCFSPVDLHGQACGTNLPYCKNLNATPTPTPVPNAGPTFVLPACIFPNTMGNAVTINWNNPSSGNVQFVEISTRSDFASYYRRGVTGTSTTAPGTPPDAFYGWQEVLGFLQLQPATTYYVRTNTGSGTNNLSYVTNFNLPLCPSPTPSRTPTPTPTPIVAGIGELPGSVGPSCADTDPYRVQVSWSSPAITSVEYWNTNTCNNTRLASEGVAGSSYTHTSIRTFSVDTTYGVRVCAGTNCSACTEFKYSRCPVFTPTPVPTIKAWIETSGGDVHTNR